MINDKVALSTKDYELCNKLKQMRFIKQVILKYPDADLDETIYDPERQLDVLIIEQFLSAPESKRVEI